ncbi:acetyl-CoA hydrolase/transferase family protein [Bacillaceae bacterium W0354]
MERDMERIKIEALKNRVVSAEEAATWIKDGMTLGLSGFTRAGDAKAVPKAIVEQAKSKHEPFKVNVYTGASLGANIDTMFAEAGIVNKRLPFQADSTMRKKINEGEILYIDQHLSHTAEMIRQNVLEPIDVAIIEALSITEDGLLIPTTSVGNSSVFVKHAKEVIIEINLAQPIGLTGIHDIYEPAEQGNRQPIPLVKPNDRIGLKGIPIDMAKVKGIVFTNQPDSPSTILPADDETKLLGEHLITFLNQEVQAGRLTKKLAPIQAGIGTTANAILYKLIDSDFYDLQVYSEVLQDAMFDLIDAGKVNFASASSITLSESMMEHVFSNFEKYHDNIILRPQEISNHPEIIRRLGLISINTALEVGIYGHVNSTHVVGRKMMNGIGGSGDFARNARLSIFLTKSIAKEGKISSVVPFVSHVDSTEHDTDVIITEQGYADLRGLAPRERAVRIINQCAHPMYRGQLMDYYERALQRGGHAPHILDEALSWHVNFEKNGTMLK